MSDRPDEPGPQHLQPATPAGGEVLDSRGEQWSVLPTDAATKHRRRWPIAVGVAAGLVVAGTGLALGMSLSGGGTQPEELVPAGAAFYADIDFDPGADQKVNLLRLLNKFPAVQDQLGGRDDLKQYLVDEYLSGTPLADGDIGAWAGDRAGVALIPSPNSTNSPNSMGIPMPTGSFVFLLQVTDEDAARSALSGVVDDNQLAFDQGYAVITQSLGMTGGQPTARDVVAAADKQSLADDPHFTSAMAPLGSGLASMYVDPSAMAAVMGPLGAMGAFGMPGSMMGLGSGSTSGQTALVVRAEPTAIEVVGSSTNVPSSVHYTPTNLFSTLPDDTAAAVAVGGAGSAIGEAWANFREQMQALGNVYGGGIESLGGGTMMQPTSLRQTTSDFDREVAKFEAKYNVQLPEDLVTIAGDDLVIAASGEGLVSGAPGIGLRSVTDPAKAADLASRLQPVIDRYTAGYGVTVKPLSDGLVIASSPQYADKLGSAGGHLMDDPRVADALPDANGAGAIGWVDFDTLSDVIGLEDPSSRPYLDPLAGLGMTVSQSGDTLSLRMRLTFDAE